MLAVHCLYYNVVYLFVIAGGAALVCAWRRRWMAGTAVLAIGGIGAASMLAYLPSMSRRSGWVILINQSIGLPWLAGRFFETLELAGAWMPWVWVGVGAAALAACVHVWRRRKTIEPPGPADQAGIDGSRGRARASGLRPLSGRVRGRRQRMLSAPWPSRSSEADWSAIFCSC